MAAETQHDPLAAALQDLRRDIDGITLASAHDVRRRGEQRARNHRLALTASSVAAVAALAVGVGTVLQPGSSGPQPTPPASPSISSSAPSVDASPRPVVDLPPAGYGSVPAAYFLPAKLWQGPDLNQGRAMKSIEPKDFEGSVQYFECDPDSSAAGDVAILQVQQVDGPFVGTQKVRLFDSTAEAADFTRGLITAMPDCQQRLRQQAIDDSQNLPAGQSPPVPTARVVADDSGRIEDADGSVHAWRTVTDYGTGPGAQQTQWIVVARQGAAVTSIAITEFEQTSVTFGTLRRLGSEARDQMRWAAAP